MKRNSFKYFFFEFFNFEVKFLEKFKGVNFEICGVINQVDHVGSEYEVKTGTGSSFRRHFCEKKKRFSGFFLGQYLRCYGGYEADI